MGLPPEFWDREALYLQAVILPRIQAMAIAGANAALDRLSSVGIAFDNALAHEAAAKWAREFTDDFLRDEFNTTTEGSVGNIVDNWIGTPGATRKHLEDELKQVLDDNASRASAFAVTESTRAFSEGDAIVYQEAGLPSLAIKPPDGDVNCRCWSAPVKLANGDWVITWQTERDTKVRTEPKTVPWGVVEGHKGLQGVVISEGPYLGMTLSEARRAARESMAQ